MGYSFIMKTLIVSDIDGTLVKGGLVLSHACYLHEMGLIDLGVLPEIWLKDQKNEVVIRALAEDYKEAIIGSNLSDIRVDEFVEMFISDEKNFYSSMQVLIEGKSDGADVHLISGSPSYLVSRFARKYGFTYSSSHYSMYRGRFTGNVRGMFDYDSKSVAMSSLEVEDYHRVEAYGDTSSDKPLFEKADYSVLVDPNEDTMEALAEHVHEVKFY